MGGAVIRTYIDESTGKQVRIMFRWRFGEWECQRYPSDEEKFGTARALENLATFGEIASRAYGLKKTAFLPPAAILVQRERPKIPLESASGSQRALRRNALRSLLPNELPAVQQEIGARGWPARQSTPLLKAADRSLTQEILPENSAAPTHAGPSPPTRSARSVAVGFNPAIVGDYLRKPLKTTSSARRAVGLVTAG